MVIVVLTVRQICCPTLYCWSYYYLSLMDSSESMKLSGCRQCRRIDGWQREIFSLHIRKNRGFSRPISDRFVFTLFLILLFIWPFFISLSSKNMLVADNVLIAIIAIIGLNLLTGFAGLISIRACRLCGCWRLHCGNPFAG